MTKYEKITVSETEVIKATLENESVVFIPIAEENADYQRYLESLKK
jgi:peptidase E